MKCFYHRDCDAVCTCKSCQRGLCPDCAVDFTEGMACRSRCEDDVEALIRLIQNNIRLSATSTSLIQATRRNGLIQAVFSLVMGAIFGWWGYSEDMAFVTSLGGLFLFFGLISFIRFLRITPPTAQP